MIWVSRDSKKGSLPIKSWCAAPDEGAVRQAMNLADHPATFHHIAMMPDAGKGFGMMIGGVMACRDAIIPSAVGYDIGCGMIAAPTKLSHLDEDELRWIIDEIKRRIPVGFNRHQEPQEWHGFDSAPNIRVVQSELENARKQLGTLGSGNHFIEIQKGDDGQIWVMIHSGSRHLGHEIASEFMATAEAQCDQWHSKLPPGRKDDSLAFLPTGTDAGKIYIQAMDFALKYAQANRDAMMATVQSIFNEHCTSAPFGTAVNIHHNFAALEHHFGEDVWVHRKGATQAREGQTGIIPGSMGTASYLVQGLGNRESFDSCSHGAGRPCSRTAFKNSHTIEECEASMKGIVFGGWGVDRRGNPDISEAPGAYKDIETVMAAQEDLVRPLLKLTPIGVVKG